jgi:hypothetical protein
VEQLSPQFGNIEPSLHQPEPRIIKAMFRTIHGMMPSYLLLRKIRPGLRQHRQLMMTPSSALKISQFPLF